MHHVFAALAEKERRLIAIAQGPALQAKKAAGAALGNRTNLTSAARLGRGIAPRCAICLHERVPAKGQVLYRREIATGESDASIAGGTRYTPAAH